MSSARTWCFTLNNPTEPINFEAWPHITYGVYQKESGENGTPHYQGYAEFSKPNRISALKKFLPTAHFEQRRGTRDQARDYCMKDESRLEGPWEHGEFGDKKPGARKDIVRLYEAVKEGKTNKEILEENPAAYMKFYRAVHHVRHVISVKRSFKTEVYVLWGATGLGKSYYCRDLSPNAYWKQRGDWWDEYDGSSDVIMDDFYGWIKWDVLLRLCDENPCQVEVKGGHVNFAPRRIFITSNNWPNKWYDPEKMNFGTFARRVTQWLYFTDYKTFIQSDSWDPNKFI